MSNKSTREFEIIDLGIAYMEHIIRSFQKVIERDSCKTEEEFKERYRFIKPVGSKKYKITIHMEPLESVEVVE